MQYPRSYDLHSFGQCLHGVESSIEGCQSVYFHPYGLLWLPRRELSELLPNVSSSDYLTMGVFRIRTFRLTSTLGYNTTISLLLAAPPWIFATIISCVNAWHAGELSFPSFHLSQ